MNFSPFTVNSTLAMSGVMFTGWAVALKLTKPVRTTKLMANIFIVFILSPKNDCMYNPKDE
ncbi:MAG TPA: hypothetical protein EYQ47_08225 [Cycloclasticus sp.]|nr:hypothetical protein [Cycloclasticus sp.]